jgi:hypothetical protein
MRRIGLLLIVVFASILGSVTPANAGSYCNNGTYSSNSGRGTCSYNGGVNKNFPSYSDPGSSSYNRNNGFGTKSYNNGFGTKSYNNGFGTKSYNNGFGTKSYNNGFGTKSYNNGFGSTKKCASWQSFC